jgi:hypothetical protein
MVKMCPITFMSGVPGKKLLGKGLPRDCQEDECMWWTGKECAITAIAKKLAN